MKSSNTAPLSNPVRVGQVGVAGFAERRRFTLKESGLFQSVAAFDINQEALQKACKEDNSRAADSFQALLEDESIEAIVISTGASAHAEQTVAALAHGKHVFVEKPLCTTQEEIEQIAQAAAKHPELVVACGHSDHAAEATTRTIRHWIESGKLGEIVGFESNSSHSGGFQLKPGDWRNDAQKNPGGMLFQCGVHKFHLLRYLFGDVDSIYAQFRDELHSSQTTDAAFTMITMKNGITGILNCFHVTPYISFLNIYGTKASIYVNHRFFDEGETVEIQYNNTGAHEPRLPLVPEFPNDELGEVKNFYRAIRDNAPCYPSWQDAADALRPVIAAAESARTNRRVSVSSTY